MKKNVFLLIGFLPLLLGCGNSSSEESKTIDTGSEEISSTPSSEITSSTSSIHEHTFEDKWTYDEEYHYHKSTCGHDVVSDKEPHSFVSTITNPTFEKEGYTTHVCKCGYSYVDSKTNKLEHNYSSVWASDGRTHWHACTDTGYEHLKKDEAKHIFNINEDNPLEMECVICKKKGGIQEVNALRYSLFDFESEIDGVKYTQAYTVLNSTNINCKEIIIPSFYNSLPVVSIENEAFSNRSSLASLFISNNISSIGIKLICFSKVVSSIEVDSRNKTFDSRNNSNSVIKTIDNSLVLGCKDSVIPSSVTSIGDYAFYGCTGLEEISLQDNITSIGTGSFQYCESLSSALLGKNLASIGMIAFCECGVLSQVTLPDSLVNLGAGAFSFCSSLSTITIPDKVTSIGAETFRGCFSLSAVKIGKSVTSIGDKAFANCNLITSITLPEGLTNIWNHAFSGCKALKSVNLPSTLVSIGDYAFQYCKVLKEIDLPSGLLSIGKFAFSQCDAFNSPIPTNVTLIDEHAFSSCLSLTSVVIPSGIKKIGDSAFSDCSNLTTVTIQEGVTSIGFSCFSRCTSLTTIVIPSTVTSTSIGMWAFNNCKAIKYCYVNWTDTSKTIQDVPSSSMYYYSETEPSEEDLKSHNYWHYVDETPTIWKLATK